MTKADWIIIGGVVAIIASTIIVIYIDRAVLKKHNQKLIDHVTATASALNVSIKNVKNDVKSAIEAQKPYLTARISEAPSPAADNTEEKKPA